MCSNIYILVRWKHCWSFRVSQEIEQMNTLYTGVYKQIRAPLSNEYNGILEVTHVKLDLQVKSKLNPAIRMLIDNWMCNSRHWHYVTINQGSRVCR